MKTYKNLYNELCSLKNLRLAYKKARKGKTKKDYVIRFERKLYENIKYLREGLLDKTYNPIPLKEFILRDPKTRKICKSIFRDRIVHHAIINIIGPILDKGFIYDSYASREGKGQHQAIERFDKFKRKVSRNGKLLKGIKDKNYICGYCFKADIAKYFDSVDHEILINIIKVKIRDDDLIWLIKQVLNNHVSNIMGKGMPLGNYTSQFFANVYLNELDYFVKHEIKAKYYIRYVDDFVILHNSKEQLKVWKEQIDRFLINELQIKLHRDKSKIVSLHKGIQFLGFRIFYYYKLLRKSNIYQMRKNLENWNELYAEGLVSHENLIEKLEGWFAHAIHGNTYGFRKEVAKNFNKIFLNDSVNKKSQ